MSGPSRAFAQRRAALAWCAAALACGLPQTARAVLGENEASIQADQVRSGAVRRQSTASGLRVHTLTRADGSTITQFVGADGLVFAVAWRANFKPRLDELLGSHFITYVEGGHEAMRQRPGVLHSAVVRRGDLVVESSAHLNAHVGRAWLRSKLPAGMPTDALR